MWERAVDVTSARPTNQPPRPMNVIEVEPCESILIGCGQQAPTPAASSLNKYVIPKLSYSGVVSKPAPSPVSTVGSSTEERKSSMVSLWQIRTRPPPPAASAVAGIESMEVADIASSSTTTLLEAGVPPAAAVQAMVRGMLVHLTAILDLVFSGPLVSI